MFDKERVYVLIDEMTRSFGHYGSSATIW